MTQATLGTIAARTMAAACFALLIAAAPSPAPPPTDSSHVIKTPARPPVAKPTGPVAHAHPGDSSWRKAYVARTGHQPPPRKPGIVTHRGPARHTAVRPHVPAKHAMHRYRRCT